MSVCEIKVARAHFEEIFRGLQTVCFVSFACVCSDTNVCVCVRMCACALNGSHGSWTKREREEFTLKTSLYTSKLVFRLTRIVWVVPRVHIQ